MLKGCGLGFAMVVYVGGFVVVVDVQSVFCAL